MRAASVAKVLAKQQRHIREYERAAQRGPPAAAVGDAKHLRTWLHKPMLDAVLTWAAMNPPDGSCWWWESLRSTARSAKRDDDDK
jgi:hypothetical protein